MIFIDARPAELRSELEAGSWKLRAQSMNLDEERIAISLRQTAMIWLMKIFRFVSSVCEVEFGEETRFSFLQHASQCR